MNAKLRLVSASTLGIAVFLGGLFVKTELIAATITNSDRKIVASKDKDGDGLSDQEEKRLSTDPKSPDTDGDGLVDGDEVKTYRTNPNKADSDDDGLSDLEEIKRFSTDPNVADSDQDGLTDGAEIREHRTEPLRPDTDGDGVSDGDEVVLHKTDPRNADSDGDGLSDGDEIKVFNSDPTAKDSDGDGLSDAMDNCVSKPETINGYNDFDGCPDEVPGIAIEVNQTIILPAVGFGVGDSKLAPQSFRTLDLLCQTMYDFPEMVFEIRGFADSLGSEKSNDELSLRRAQSVANYLISKGIDAARVKAVGYGEESPVASNHTEQGRKKNRRIEIYRLK